MPNIDPLALVILLSDAVARSSFCANDDVGDIPTEITVLGLARQVACDCERICYGCSTDYFGLCHGLPELFYDSGWYFQDSGEPAPPAMLAERKRLLVL